MQVLNILNIIYLVSITQDHSNRIPSENQFHDKLVSKTLINHYTTAGICVQHLINVYI